MPLDPKSDDLSFLDESNNVGYGARDILCDRDIEIQIFLHKLTKLDSKTKTELLSKISLQHCRVLLSYAERMASHAVRTNSTQPITDGLVALGLTAGQADHTEILPILSLLYRSTCIISGNPDEIFQPTIGTANDRLAKYFTDFLSRNDEDKSISVMGYTEGSDAGGFRFMRAW